MTRSRGRWWARGLKIFKSAQRYRHPGQAFMAPELLFLMHYLHYGDWFGKSHFNCDRNYFWDKEILVCIKWRSELSTSMYSFILLCFLYVDIKLLAALRFCWLGISFNQLYPGAVSCISIFCIKLLPFPTYVLYHSSRKRNRERDSWLPHLTIFACLPLRVMPVLCRQLHLLWTHSYTVTCVHVMVFDSTILLHLSFFFSIPWTMKRGIQMCWLGQSIPWSPIFHTFTSYKFVLSIYYWQLHTQMFD